MCYPGCVEQAGSARIGVGAPAAHHDALQPSRLVLFHRRDGGEAAMVLIERFVALDVHKHYVMVAAIDAAQQVVRSPRKLSLERFAESGARTPEPDRPGGAGSDDQRLDAV